MQKWSVRVPDEIADLFRDFCVQSGVSIQGAVEAAVTTTAETFRAQGRRRVSDWFPDVPDVRDAWSEYVQSARNLDARKRSRS